MIFCSYDYELSQDDTQYIYDTYKQDRFLRPGNGSYYTGYHTHPMSRARYKTEKFDDKKIVTMYSSFLAKCLREQGYPMEDSILSYNHIWAQIYLKEKGSMNAPHNHYISKELCSWIHFVNVPDDQDCLYFQIGDTKVYPKEQRSGKLIFFPSWAFHGVDPITTTKERVVVAGNIVKLL
mgnify:FL=1|tara:strand:+ start:2351 stop:2887 length:537 start_codon:yes stop_codon:yes gene_type:complete